MAIALFAHKLTEISFTAIKELLQLAQTHYKTIYIEENTHTIIKQSCANLLTSPKINSFKSAQELPETIQLFFAFGGDGTILRAQHFIAEKQIPIVGINTGRLGFLAYFSLAECTPETFLKLFKGKYEIESRALLEVQTFIDDQKYPLAYNLALNEITISKKTTASMIKIVVKLNQELLNNYWADGLIIATPTGSTGYSLSCGGPIIDPRTHNFVITPIAPHNLFMRPFIISDTDKLQIHIESREEEFILNLDTHNYLLAKNIKLEIKKAPAEAKIVKCTHHSYLNALKEKLFWGLDQRNTP